MHNNMPTNPDALAAMGADDMTAPLDDVLQQMRVLTDTPAVSSNRAHALPVDGLPAKFVELCKHIAESRSVPQEVTILSALTIAGAGVGAYVTSNICGYENRPGLWTMIVAPSASGKTQPLKDLMRPLDRIDQQLVHEYMTKLEAWRMANAAAKNPTPTPRPNKTQIKCEVSTDAGRVEFLCDNPRGGIFFRDELRALFDSFKGNFAIDARNRMLEISDFGSVKATTKTEDTIKTAAYSFMPILGGIQPRVLPRTIKPEDIDQGLLQRFIVCVFDADDFPEMSSGVRADLAAWWDNTVQSLRGLGNVKWEYKATPEALQVYADEYRKLAVLARPSAGDDDDYNDYKRTIVSKSLKFVHRAALIAHCLKIVDKTPDYPYSHPDIDADTMRWAFSCVPYIVAQQMKVYDAIVGKKTKRKTDAEMIREFAAWYQGRRGEKINRSKLADVTGIKRQNIGLYLRDEAGPESTPT